MNGPHKHRDRSMLLFFGVAMCFPVVLTVGFTLSLWFFTSFSAYGAERQERSAPYDRQKEFSTSMLYYPEQPMVEWDLKPYLDFVEGGNAAATAQQWAEALHKKGKIDEPTWAKARAYLATLKWQKNAAKEWWRMWRILRPYGKWQVGRLDSGYERAFEAGEWGLHDPTTGELVVAGDCGNVVVEKLTPATATPAPTPAPPRPAAVPPPAPTPIQPAAAPAAAPPAPSEPTRVAAPPRPQPDGPAKPTDFAVATLGPPTEATKLYQIFVVRDPGNLLMGWGRESMDVKDVNTALQWIRSGKVSMVETGKQVARFTLFDKATPSERRRDAITCNEGRPVATYDVPIDKGYGSVRFRLADLLKGKCLRAELPDSLKRPGGNPATGMIDWAVPDNIRPDELWFVLP